MLIRRLPGTIVLTIDRRETLRDLHGRTIAMTRDGAPLPLQVALSPLPA
jgi:hypothetical protein